MNIIDFAKRIIEGVGGLNDFERYELAVPHVSDRVWAADWTIRCLANPKCEGSEEVLAAIMERRAAVAQPMKSEQEIRAAQQRFDTLARTALRQKDHESYEVCSTTAMVLGWVLQMHQWEWKVEAFLKNVETIPFASLK